MLRISPSLAVVLLLLAPALVAQSGPDRAALAAYRDSLAADSTPAGVDSLDQGSQGTIGKIRDGLADLRRGELGKPNDRGPFDAALRELERACSAESDWPWPWYGLGLTRLAMWDRRLTAKATPYQPQGTSYRRAAMDAFARALKADSGFTPASGLLAGLVTALGHRALPDDYLPALRRAALTPGVSPEVQLAIARLEYQAHHYDAVLIALGDYLREGGDSGLARLEQARTLYALGRDSTAVAAYFSGVGAGGDLGRAAYRLDLAWVAADWELGQYDSLPPDQLQPWVRKFWRERDALALRAPNERIREHLRRWVFVHDNYLIHRPDDAPIHAEGQSAMDQQDLFTDYDEDVAIVMTDVALTSPGFKQYTRVQWEVDDRGVIYMRHGPPDHIAISPSGPPNESWAYDLPQGRRVFHFLGSRALGTTAATTLVAALPMIPELLDSRGALDPRYVAMASDLQRRIAQARGDRMMREAGAADPTQARLARNQRAALGATGAAAAVQGAALPGGAARSSLHPETVYRELARGREAIAAGVTTDGYPQHFKRSLDGVMELYGVGVGPGERQRILAVFAVPGRNLVPHARPDGGPGLLYPIAIRLIAMDRAAGVVRQLDTVRTFLTRDTLRGEQHLTGWLELPVPPGVYDVRAMLTSPGVDAGSGAGRDSVAFAASPDSLTLSDIILGRQGQLSWPFAGSPVPLNPLDTYPRGATATLFFELAGLHPGRHYRIAFAIRRPRDKPDQRPQVSVGFDVTARAGYQRERREIGLENLKPGAYLLQTTVAEADGGPTIVRTRALNILDH